MKTLEEMGLHLADSYTIKVVVDTNDANYIEKSQEIDAPILQELLNFYLQEREEQKKIAKSEWEKTRVGIKFEVYDGYITYNDKEPHEDEMGNIRICEGRYISQENYELMRVFCPYYETGFHSIERIEISPAVQSVIF